MRRISFVLIAFFTVAILMTGCTKPGKKPVIKVGDWTMDVDTFREVLRSSYGSDNLSKLTEGQINSKIHDLVAQRLVTNEAYKLSLDTLEFARSTFESQLNDRAMKALQTQVVIDKVLTEKMLKDFYMNDKYEVRAFHILIKDGDKRSIEEAEHIADSLYQVAIQPGTDFIQLAKKYNEDVTTPAGDIGWFGWGTMVPKFQEKVWSMNVNDISEPLLTDYGWHIIRLAGRREKTNRPPFALDKNRIRSRLIELHGQELLNRSHAFIDSLKTAHKVSVNRDAVEMMVSKLKTTGDLIHSANPFRQFTDQELSSDLATFDVPPGILRIQDVSDYMNRYVRPQERILTDETVDRQLDIIISQLYLMPYEVKKRGLPDEEEVVHGAREAVDYYVFNYIKNQRREKLPLPSEVKMKAYYQSHLSSFTNPKRYEGIEVLVDSPVLARKIYRWVIARQSIEDLAAKYTVRTNGRANRGHLGPFREGTFGPLSDALSKAKVGDIVGPIDLRDGYSVFKLTKIYEPTPQPFDSVREKIADDMKNESAKTDYEAWTDSLMQVEPNKIYRKNLKYVFDDKD
ncbi:MAG: peptidylprolyl isomerase [bacterium]